MRLLRNPLLWWSAVGLMVIAQSCWYLWPERRSLVGQPYRNRQRLEAFDEAVRNPSPVAEEQLRQEMLMVSRHAGRKKSGLFVALLGLDAVFAVVLLKKSRKAPPDPKAT